MSHRLHGHAIVSADDRIADAEGRFSDALRCEADWVRFQAALDRTALSLIGRASHEAAPNVKGRLRLIVSRQVRGLVRRADGWWWNPADLSLAEALARVLPEGGDVGVPGGQAVYDLVGAAGFATFHLARARRVGLPGGRGLFAACEQGVPAEEVLSAGGLVADPPVLLDAAAEVELTVWRRPDPPASARPPAS